MGDVLGVTQFEERSNFLVEKFWDWLSHDFEPEKSLPSRKRFWGWMVGSIEASPLKLSHLVRQADRYDVVHLLTLVKKFLAVENPQTFCEKVNGFFYCSPQGGRIFFLFMND